MYAWSLRSLSCRLHHFGIQYIDYDIDVGEVKEAVKKELDGPGSLLGYRTLHNKIREVHELNVPRNLVSLTKLTDMLHICTTGHIQFAFQFIS